MLPVLIVGGVAALLWALLSEKPGGVYALWAKRYSDGWEVYILSFFVRTQNDAHRLDELFEGTDLEKAKGDKETASRYSRYEYVALNKLQEKVYHGFIASRFSTLGKEEVCDAVKEYLQLDDKYWKGKDKGLLVDRLRFITVRKFTGEYIPLEALEKTKRVKEWL